MGYIVRHSFPLRGTSVNKIVRSVAVRQHLLEGTYIHFLVFWKGLVKITHEFHLLTSGLEGSSAYKTRLRRPRITSVNSCTYLLVLVYEYPVPGG